MTFDWITHPLAIYSALACGGAAALHLVISTRIEMRWQQKGHLAEEQSLRDSIATLESQVQQLRVEVEQNFVTPAPYISFTGLNVHKRAEALRMYRRGSDSHTVSAALGLPQSEVVLLEKVHRLLSRGSAG
ncbi:MAG: hypothetical protein ABI759_01710 [Candidatus Solibacter sp.]